MEHTNPNYVKYYDQSLGPNVVGIKLETEETNQFNKLDTRGLSPGQNDVQIKKEFEVPITEEIEMIFINEDHEDNALKNTGIDEYNSPGYFESDRLDVNKVSVNPSRGEPLRSHKINKQSGKRKRQPHLWARNIKKKQRENGQEYTDYKGNSKPAKTIKPGCTHNCTFMCFSKLPSNLREKINSDFYNLTDAQKYKYYDKYTKRITKDRKRTKVEKSRRTYSFQYFLPNGSEISRVCKTFFCSTLDISVRRIYYYHMKKENSDDMIPPTPAKGKHVKKVTPPNKINEVIDHIRSFPTLESHYFKSCSSRQYLNSDLSIKKMHELYLEQYKDPVKENIYRRVFCEKFNLGFNRPKKDVCDLCFEIKEQKNPNDDVIQKYEQHLERKKEGNDERQRDLNLKTCECNDTAVITFDLENMFALPKANFSCFHYMSKLTVYNLTAHCDINKSVTNAFWDETRCDKSGDDLASVVTKILNNIVTTLPGNITKLILWSDSRILQYRSSNMTTALIKFLHSDVAKNINIVIQKYSEPGTSKVQEVDTVHSLIERNLRNQEIYSPLSLLRALVKIKSKAVKLTFLQMQDEDFLPFHKQAINYNFNQIPYNKVKSLIYSKSEWNIIKYQTSFLGPIETVDILKEQNIRIINEVIVKEANNVLTQKKIDDIRSVYKYMPTEDTVYMEALIIKAEKLDNKE